MTIKDIIIATKNRGKLKEFKDLFSNYFENIESLLDHESVPEIVEDGSTFEENALLKATTISSLFNKVVLADDSGLVVEALNGEPGIYSARYAGEGSTDDENTDKLLSKIKPYKNRKAKFVSVIALVYPSSEAKVFKGICEGLIINEKRGNNGFGYDPIFFLPDLNKTMAEISSDLKNRISHRSKAVMQLKNYLDSK